MKRKLQKTTRERFPRKLKKELLKQMSRPATLATEVHHTVPVESMPHELGMRQLMFDYNNLQSLCHSCHSDAHRRAFSHSKEAVQANNKRATERFADRFLKDNND